MRSCFRGRAGVLALVLFGLVGGVACASKAPPNNEAQSASNPGTGVHFKAATPGTNGSIVDAVALWKQVDAAKVDATITGYDQDGRFTLSTNDPTRLRQVVTEFGRTPATKIVRGCPTEEPLPVETEQAPNPQPSTGARDRVVDVYQTAGPLAAGTAAEAAFSGDQIQQVTVSVDSRPATVAVVGHPPNGKQAAADFGPGLIVVEEMFVDPATANLTRRPEAGDGKNC